VFTSALPLYPPTRSSRSRPDGRVVIPGCRTIGTVGVAIQMSAAGSYARRCWYRSSPHTIISVPVQTAVCAPLGGQLTPVEVAVQASATGSYRPPSLKFAIPLIPPTRSSGFPSRRRCVTLPKWAVSHRGSGCPGVCRRSLPPPVFCAVFPSSSPAHTIIRVPRPNGGVPLPCGGAAAPARWPSRYPSPDHNRPPVLK